MRIEFLIEYEKIFNEITSELLHIESKYVICFFTPQNLMNRLNEIEHYFVNKLIWRPSRKTRLTPEAIEMRIVRYTINQ